MQNIHRIMIATICGMVLASQSLGAVPLGGPERAPTAGGERGEAVLTWAETATRIDQCKEALSRSPNDLAMKRKLAALYMVRARMPQESPDGRKRDMAEAQSMGEEIYRRDPEDVENVRFLAILLAGTDTTGAGAARGLALFDRLVTGNDGTKRFQGLVAKGELLETLRAPPAIGEELRKRGVIKRPTVVDEAIAIYQEAIGVEPANTDDAERHLADLYFNLGRIAEAEAVYARVVEANKNPAVHDGVVRRLIETELRQDMPAAPEDRVKLRDALARLEPYLRDHPEDTQAWILRAFAWMTQATKDPGVAAKHKLLQAARSDLNHALEASPGDGNVLYYRAIVLVRLGDDDGAIIDLQKAARDARAAMNARIMLTVIYQRQQRLQDAKTCYEELIRLFPNEVDVKLRYAEFLVGLVSQEQALPPGSQCELGSLLQQFGPATILERLIQRGAQSHPQDAHFPLLRAQLAAKLGKNDEALRLFTALRQSLPYEKQAVEGYLEALNKTKNEARTVETATAVLKSVGGTMDNAPEGLGIYLLRAAAYQGLGRSQEALQDVAQVYATAARVVAASKKPGVFVTLHEQALRLLPRETVIAALRNRVKAEPGDVMTSVALMQTLVTAKKPAEALELSRAFNLGAEAKEVRLVAQLQMANAEADAGDAVAAERDYQAVLQMDPDNVQALNNYAFWLANERNMPAKGVELAQQARQLLLMADVYDADRSAAVHNTLGWALLCQGDVAEATNMLKRSLLMMPSGDTFGYLALALEKSGKTDEAAKALAEGKKFDADLPKLVAKVRQRLKPEAK